MLVEIESQGYKATVTNKGAELVSLIDPLAEQYMWSGDARYWSGRAPILFPVIGCLKDNCYTLAGDRFEMPRHGLVRGKDWDLIAQTAATVSFSTRADSHTLKHYPFDFELQAHFELNGPLLQINYRVINHSDCLMSCSLGSHPAFALPITAGDGLDQWSIEFSEVESLDCQVLVNGLVGENPIREYLNNSRRLALSDSIFNDDALVFLGLKSPRLDLVHRTRGRRLSLHTGGAPDLGVWAVPGASYVCLEPWYGHADPLHTSGQWSDKPGLIAVDSGKHFETFYRIEPATATA